MHHEGEFFVRKRLGKQPRRWGVYQRLGGQDIMVTSFTTELAAITYVEHQCHS